MFYSSPQIPTGDTRTSKQEGHSTDIQSLDILPLQELWAWSMSSIAKNNQLEIF